MVLENSFCGWVENYSDVSSCIELMAVYDDVLKKNDNFCNFAVDVANRIIEDLDIKDCIATWGKWGARLESEKNSKLNREELEFAAISITDHPAWLNLKALSYVFTYGRSQDE